jgi:hypothetical protein
MGSHDMDHMQHLETVAHSDVSVLHFKESTYQGSWKRAGGRSAWFMARRNADRLITLMSPKQFPGFVNRDNINATLAALRDWVHYSNQVTKLPGSIEATMQIIDAIRDMSVSEDLFGKIAEKPSGKDGTVLACVRDLRRYLLLVEAEMIAEGVVEPETPPVTFYQPPTVDAYQMMANETGLSRDEVKRRCHEACYSVDPGAANGGRAGPPTPRKVDVKTVDVHAGPVYAGGMVHEKGKHPRLPTNEELLQMGYPPRTPEDGSHHASQVPWVIEREYYEVLVQRVGKDIIDAFYSHRAGLVWRLEPIVAGQEKCPREIAQCYTWHRSSDASYFWVLNRVMVPEDLNDQFLRLQPEMNQFEYDQSEQTYRFMYSYQDGPQKWTLRDEFQVWAREF